MDKSAHKNYELIEFEALPPIQCPCGTAKRALIDEKTVPYSLHLTKISASAKVHYHQKTTETYFFLDCEPDAAMELDGEVVPVRPKTAITIYPQTRHRAIGEMQVIIIASPKFDSADEWFD